MTTGALIFAFNNEHIDYVKMAAWNAKNIRRHLGIPTAIVTDADPTDPRLNDVDKVIVGSAQSGGTRRFEDYDATVSWYNASRTDAYQLSPWDRTVVLDADYVVASSQLQVAIESNQEFLSHAAAFDITSVNDFQELNHYGMYRMPMSWATVMIFSRSQHVELIFDCMQMIKNNWQHYKNVYRNVSNTYRNDHALSIALHIVNGQTLTVPSIPWKLASVTPEHEVLQIAEDCYRINYRDRDQRARWITLNNQDFHAMGKQHLEKIIETH